GTAARAAQHSRLAASAAAGAAGHSGLTARSAARAAARSSLCASSTAGAAGRSGLTACAATRAAAGAAFARVRVNGRAVAAGGGGEQEQGRERAVHQKRPWQARPVRVGAQVRWAWAAVWSGDAGWDTQKRMPEVTARAAPET